MNIIKTRKTKVTNIGNTEGKAFLLLTNSENTSQVAEEHKLKL